MKPPEHHFVDEYGQREIKLSVAGNASSTVTNLTIKTKHAFTTVKNERTHNHMRKLLEEVGGYRISMGCFAKGFAERLRLNPSPEMTACVTRRFVDGATSDNSPEAKEFQQAMRQADDYKRNLPRQAAGRRVRSRTCSTSTTRTCKRRRS